MKYVILVQNDTSSSSVKKRLLRKTVETFVEHYQSKSKFSPFTFESVVRMYCFSTLAVLNASGSKSGGGAHGKYQSSSNLNGAC